MLLSFINYKFMNDNGISRSNSDLSAISKYGSENVSCVIQNPGSSATGAKPKGNAYTKSASRCIPHAAGSAEGT